MKTIYFHRDPILDLFATAAFYITHPKDGRSIKILASDSRQIILDFENVDRRLVCDKNFGYMWYNAKEPEEVDQNGELPE